MMMDTYERLDQLEKWLKIVIAKTGPYHGEKEFLARAPAPPRPGNEVAIINFLRNLDHPNWHLWDQLAEFLDEIPYHSFPGSNAEKGEIAVKRHDLALLIRSVGPMRSSPPVSGISVSIGEKNPEKDNDIRGAKSASLDFDRSWDVRDDIVTNNVTSDSEQRNVRRALDAGEPMPAGVPTLLDKVLDTAEAIDRHKRQRHVDVTKPSPILFERTIDIEYGTRGGIKFEVRVYDNKQVAITYRSGSTAISGPISPTEAGQIAAALLAAIEVATQPIAQFPVPEPDVTMMMTAGTRLSMFVDAVRERVDRTKYHIHWGQMASSPARVFIDVFKVDEPHTDHLVELVSTGDHPDNVRKMLDEASGLLRGHIVIDDLIEKFFPATVAVPTEASPLAQFTAAVQRVLGPAYSLRAETPDEKGQWHMELHRVIVVGGDLQFAPLSGRFGAAGFNVNQAERIRDIIRSHTGIDVTPQVLAAFPVVATPRFEEDRWKHCPLEQCKREGKCCFFTAGCAVDIDPPEAPRMKPVIDEPRDGDLGPGEQPPKGRD